MALPSFFRINKNRRFNYIPRYYDEDKEDLKERIRKIELELGYSSNPEYQPSIRRGMMTRSYHRRKKERTGSGTRFVIILVILLLLSYFLFFY